jgi:paraquat-inducible protein B
MSEKEQRRAEERHGWWPGWIWSIPVAAVGLVIWLAVRSWTQTGPEVTVIFPVIADLRPGDTKVKFEDFAVGEVEDVQLEPDLKHMRAKLQLNTDMQNHLGDGTQFWIIGQSFSLAHLSDVKALVSGVSVGISPRPGKAQDTYQGLAQEPVLQFGKTGEAFTLHMNELGSVKRGTPVFYLGERVGEIKDYRMTGDRGFEATAIVNAPYDRMVHANSRFWRAGPVHLSSDGTGPTVQFQSVPALFEARSTSKPQTRRPVRSPPRARIFRSTRIRTRPATRRAGRASPTARSSTMRAGSPAVMRRSR